MCSCRNAAYRGRLGSSVIDWYQMRTVESSLGHHRVGG